MTYPYPMPKSRTIIRLHSHLSAGLAPHGISCHYKSDKQLFYNVLIRCNFAPSEYDRGKNALRRILCSNEQSKLCFRQTKTILSDGNLRTSRKSGGICSKVAIPEKKKYKSKNQTDGEDKCEKDGQEAQE